MPIFPYMFYIKFGYFQNYLFSLYERWPHIFFAFFQCTLTKVSDGKIFQKSMEGNLDTRTTLNAVNEMKATYSFYVVNLNQCFVFSTGTRTVSSSFTRRLPRLVDFSICAVCPSGAVSKVPRLTFYICLSDWKNIWNITNFEEYTLSIWLTLVGILFRTKEKSRDLW